MIIPTHHLGQAGEGIAASYLTTQGYAVRERNVRFGRYEIDLIADDPTKKMLVFIEVKTRRSHSESYPIAAAFTRRKRSALYHGLYRWIARHSYDGPFRIDLISVHRNRVIDHHQDVGGEVL